MATKEELLEKLKNGVVEYQEDEVKEASQQALDDGYDALEMIMDGLAAGMEVVGDLYDRNEYFVPEVLMCADALYAGIGYSQTPRAGERRQRQRPGGDWQHSGRCSRHR